MDEAQAMEILECAIDSAEADAVEASIGDPRRVATRFADNVITQNVSKEDRGISVSCAFGSSHAAASTNSLSDDSIRSVVRRAEAAAKVSPPDPEYMPPVSSDEHKRYPKVNAYFGATAVFDPRARARAIVAAAAMVRSKGYRLSGAFSSGDSFSTIANSDGLRAFHRSTFAEIHVTVLGEAGSGWAQKTSNDVDDIDIGEVVSEAVSIAQRAQNPDDIEPGKYDVVLSPAAVAELIPWYMICDAKATDEERTFLRGKLGKQVCGENITVRSDPGDPRCPGSPFHGDGLTSPTLPWVEKGVLKNLATSRYWAKKTGRKPTGFPSNVIIDGGETAIGQMIAETERGILVTRFWYIRFVDPMKCLLTGMTRDGLFLIEGGKIAGPVKNLRFNESVPEVLSRVESLGRPERIGNVLVPALKVRDFHFTSTTKF